MCLLQKVESPAGAISRARQYEIGDQFIFIYCMQTVATSRACSVDTSQLLANTVLFRVLSLVKVRETYGEEDNSIYFYYIVVGCSTSRACSLLYSALLLLFSCGYLLLIEACLIYLSRQAVQNSKHCERFIFSIYVVHQHFSGLLFPDPSGKLLLFYCCFSLLSLG